VTIIDVLKLEGGVNPRLTVGDSWLVWDEAYSLWVIYRQQYGRRVEAIGTSSDEAMAVAMLLEAAGVDVVVEGHDAHGR
jgi:hypothetical protein